MDSLDIACEWVAAFIDEYVKNGCAVDSLRLKWYRLAKIQGFQE